MNEASKRARLVPEFVEQIHERIVDHECDGHIETDAAQPRHGALVEGGRSFVAPNLHETIGGVLVLGRL